MAAGLDATEGGPVSYCLPYSRMPLDASVTALGARCELLAGLRETGAVPHLETFGGCMLGPAVPAEPAGRDQRAGVPVLPRSTACAASR